MALDGIDGKPVVQQQAPIVQTGETKDLKQVEKPLVIDNQVKGEYGVKLLSQVMPTFVNTARIDKADRADLDEMFTLAGVKTCRIPTVAQYNSISASVGAIGKNIDELETTNNVEALFKSPEFALLNEEFGIG